MPAVPLVAGHAAQDGASWPPQLTWTLVLPSLSTDVTFQGTVKDLLPSAVTMFQSHCAAHCSNVKPVFEKSWRPGEPEPTRVRLKLKELTMAAALTGSVDTSARCRVPRYAEPKIRCARTRSG